MEGTLHIFALNEPLTVSHTNLTRQSGETPLLPPLASWLGVDNLNTDQIEVFPLEDLGTMTLSDYIRLAFGPETDIPSGIVTKLDALSGAVLLIPGTALSTPAKPGPQATSIASIALAQPNNSATLLKASVAPSPVNAPQLQDHEAPPPIALFALIGMAILGLIIFFIGWS